MSLHVSDAPGCASSNSKTLALKHLQPPDAAASSGRPDGARIVHDGTDELPLEQDSVPDGETTSPFRDRTPHSQSRGSFFLT